MKQMLAELSGTNGSSLIRIILITGMCMMLCFSFLLSACSGSDEKASQKDDPVGTEIANDEPVTITVAMSTFGFEQFDPVASDGDMTNNILSMIYDTLFDITPDGGIAPGIVEEWEHSEDRLNWTFHLRQGVEFHDGWGEVTAEDVQFGLERIKERTVGQGGVITDSIDSMEVVDAYTLKLHITEANADVFPFPLLGPTQDAGHVVCKKYLTETAGDDLEAQIAVSNKKPIGTGPYRFVSHASGDSVIIEAIENHWRVTPEVDRVEFLLIPESATQVAMLKSGEIDICTLSVDQIAEVETAGKEIGVIPQTGSAGLHFIRTSTEATEGFPTADIRVRKALGLAINNEELINTLVQGYASLPYKAYDISPDACDFDPVAFGTWCRENLRYDPEEAKRLLEEAGYPDGFSGLKVYTFSRSGQPWLQSLSEAAVGYWSEIGVEAEIVPIEWGTYRSHWAYAPLDDTFNAGQCNFFGGIFLPGDAYRNLRVYHLSDEGSCKGINDLELDALIHQIPTIADDDLRKEVTTEAVIRAMNSWVSINLFNVDTIYGLNPDKIDKWTVIRGEYYLARPIESIVTK